MWSDGLCGRFDAHLLDLSKGFWKAGNNTSEKWKQLDWVIQNSMISQSIVNYLGPVKVSGKSVFIKWWRYRQSQRVYTRPVGSRNQASLYLSEVFVMKIFSSDKTCNMLNIPSEFIVFAAKFEKHSLILPDCYVFNI